MEQNGKKRSRGRPPNPLNTQDPYTTLAARKSTVLAFRLLAKQKRLSQDDALRDLLGMELRAVASQQPDQQLD